ncbi:hypothetical protein CONCODRAFT_9731 [Conidiobolus coronatus NRRL 28638]|uniref:Uncharacterized protein n=1 Tax=Conidiobolus coronatus (strain ATCC 28846 / CBS 209.66 / NRRL 28638) TaxID=796925 RepID=A0A137NZK5_CONC2|nr:hypothetical protein CONCODRAFT_9731 [Conidiobolus coronatus NRRL 28638]|eukprot:KXN68091.1 hypothetical protein CONCODRAFT_9731 [Conidiobolus coronatus NRRL 28638]
MAKKSFYNNRRGYNPNEHRPKSIQKFKNKNEKPKLVDEDKKEDMLKLILQSKLSNNTVLTFQHKNKIKMDIKSLNL